MGGNVANNWETIIFIFASFEEGPYGLISCPEGWGQILEQHQNIYKPKMYLDGILPILTPTNKEQHELDPVYKPERSRILQINDKAKYEALSPFMHILESPIFAKHCIKKLWFQPLMDDNTSYKYRMDEIQKEHVIKHWWLMVLLWYKVSNPTPTWTTTFNDKATSFQTGGGTGARFIDTFGSPSWVLGLFWCHQRSHLW
jgi:hypothetical protein